jgi:hypothetical protein
MPEAKKAGWIIVRPSSGMPGLSAEKLLYGGGGENIRENGQNPNNAKPGIL